MILSPPVHSVLDFSEDTVEDYISVRWVLLSDEERQQTDCRVDDPGLIKRLYGYTGGGGDCGGEQTHPGRIRGERDALQVRHRADRVRLRVGRAGGGNGQGITRVLPRLGRELHSDTQGWPQPGVDWRPRGDFRGRSLLCSTHTGP